MVKTTFALLQGATLAQSAISHWVGLTFLVIVLGAQLYFYNLEIMTTFDVDILTSTCSVTGQWHWMHSSSRFSRTQSRSGWIGSGCSVATEPTAEISHYYNITQVIQQ